MRNRSFHQRMTAAADIVLEFVPRDALGEPRAVDAGTTVTVVASRRSDGATVNTGTVVEPDTGLYNYTATIAAADNTSIDELDVVWTVDTVNHARTVQVVGAAYFDIDSAAKAGHDLFPEARHDDARRHRARLIAETECERITNRAFVPTMAREKIMVRSWGALLLVDQIDPQLLRSVTEHDHTGAVNKTWTAAELAATFLHDYGAIERLDTYWDRGMTTVTYDHGLDIPPPDLAEAVARRFVYWMAQPQSAVPDHAQSWSAADGGGTFRLDRGKPGMTGVPEIDNVYLDYANRTARAGVS